MEEVKMILLMVGSLTVALAALEAWKWSAYNKEDDWTEGHKKKKP